MHKLLYLLIFLFSFAGCSSWRPQPVPTVDLPDNWGQAVGGQSAKLSVDWWKQYNDAALDALVKEALEHNRDLALAAARVDEARALTRVTNAVFFPVVDLSAQADRRRNSEVGAVPLPASAISSSDYRAQFNVSYEIDFWGRLRAANAQARAELLATEAARDTVTIALAADVVRGYYSLRALDEQLAVTRRALALREETLKLQRVRAQAGLTGEYPLRQFEAEAAAVRAQIPALERTLKNEELALATLAGRSPRAIVSGGVTRGPVSEALVPVPVPEGLPSELLLRRADITQAEQRITAAGARTEALRKAVYPRFALTGYLGSESRVLSDFLSAPSLIWQAALAIAQPVFQAGRSQAEIAANQARERQALEQYQKTVQEAFREVAVALNSQTRSREVFEAETARAALLEEALKLARIRLDNGLVSQLEVIDAERNLLAARVNRIEALRAQRAAVADLARALGGGWSRGVQPRPAPGN